MRDSNPRWSCPHYSFQDCRLQPLGQPSVGLPAPEAASNAARSIEAVVLSVNVDFACRATFVPVGTRANKIRVSYGVLEIQQHRMARKSLGRTSNNSVQYGGLEFSSLRPIILASCQADDRQGRASVVRFDQHRSNAPSEVKACSITTW